MKLHNFKHASTIVSRIQKLEKAAKDLEAFILNFDGDSDGTSKVFDRNGLWGFHISEYSDGSGKNHIDLSGCLIGTSILKELESKINAQLLADHALLETL